MIYQDIQITVNQGLAVPDKSLYIFRGDSNIILNFKLVTPQYMLTKDKKDNLVTRFGVDNFELRLQLDKDYNKIIRGVITEDGCCRTQLTQNAIQELRTGTYSYQITLIDDDNNAIMTFPVCKAKLNILDRMSLTAEELAIPGGLTGEAMADLSLIADNGKVIEAFDSNGNYIKTNWKAGDVITSANLNKIEEGIDEVNKKANQKRDNNVKINAYDLDVSSNAKKIQLNNLSEEVINAISGNASVNANIANDAITRNKYADRSITFEKLENVVLSKNLFNEFSLIKGYFITSANGKLSVNNSYVCTDFIKVKPSTNYTRSYIDQLAFYDKNEVYIMGKTYSDPNTITSPDNACYVRLCCPQSEINTFQFEEGDVQTEYEPYKASINGLKIPYNDVVIDDYTIDYEKMQFDIGHIIGDYNVIDINSKTKTVKVLPNTKNESTTYVAIKNHIFHLPVQTLDISNINFGRGVFIYYNRDTKLLEAYNNSESPTNKGLIFITSIYNDVVSFNQHAIIYNGINSLSRSIKARETEMVDLLDIPGTIVNTDNLFNPYDITEGFFCAVGSGELSVNNNYCVSGHIKVKPNTMYYRSIIDQLPFFDRSKKPIGGVSYYDSNVFVTPENCYYIRASMELKRIGEFYIIEGDVPVNPQAFSFSNNAFSLQSNNIKQDGIISPKALEGYVSSKNIFNQNTISKGYYVQQSSGNLASNANYFASDYISVSPNTIYCRNVIDQMAFYDINKKYLKGQTYTDPEYFTTPSNCAYIRVCAPLSELPTYQVELGSEPTSYVAFGYTFDGLMSNSNEKYIEPIYTLAYAWSRWQNDDKFPIGFLGDSTTDGVGTTGWSQAKGHAEQDTANGGWGTVDYIHQYAYSYILEQLIKEETGTSNPRVYNIGYSGTHFKWLIPKLEDIFDGVYSDVKMVGLVHGINDRNQYDTTAKFKEGFKNNLETVIRFLFDKGIQPFMVTTQAVIETGTNDVNLPLRTSENINSIANECKKELAKKYNLEVLDMNAFGELVLTYSKYTPTQLCKDRLHFGDIGHKLEAGYLFSQICPRTIIVNDMINDTILSFTSQNACSDMSSNKITFAEPAVQGFKTKAEFTKEDNNDLLIQDFWIINESRGLYELSVHVPTVNSNAYVILDGEQHMITAQNQTIANLEIGLHHIQFFTGNTSAVSCYGFKLKYIN